MKTKKYLTPEDVAIILRISVKDARELIDSINEDAHESGLLRLSGYIRFAVFERAVFPNLIA